MASVFNRSACAAHHLRTYTEPRGNRAFAAYDRLGEPFQLDPVDLMAPGILQAPVRGEHVIAMFQAEGAFAELRLALQAVVADEAAASARFEDLDLNSEDGPWGLVRASLRASDRTPRIKASIVTKILHRKRPHLVPIFDSKVAQFYGITPARPWGLWPLLQQDVQQHSSWLDQLASGITTPDGRPLSRLRTLDIVIWEHMTSGECE